MSSFLFILFSSSNEYRYLCPDCGKGFTHPSTRIKNRTTNHGYYPYHTSRYYARQQFNEAEKRAKANFEKDRLPKRRERFPTQHRNALTSSSSADSLDNLLASATYHNDVWKPFVDVPCRDATELKVSQDVQISAPVAASPVRDTLNTLRSDSDLSTPKVGQQPDPRSKNLVGKIRVPIQ